MQQKPSPEESCARAQEGEPVAPVVGDAKPDDSLPERGLPLGTFRNREIQPIASDVQDKEHSKEPRPEEANDLAGSFAGRKFRELFWDVMRHRVERRYHRHEERENGEVYRRGEKAQPKICVCGIFDAQRNGVGGDTPGRRMNGLWVGNTYEIWSWGHGNEFFIG